MPIYSKYEIITDFLFPGEFVLSEWLIARLNVRTAVKRGLYTIHESLVIKVIGKLADVDIKELKQSLIIWLEL